MPNPLYASFHDGHLHKDVVLPLLVGVKSCGFYLYGTPLIYTQEVRGGADRTSFRNSGLAENMLGQLGSGSFVNMESVEGHDSEVFSLPRFSSVNPPEGGGFQAFDQLNRRGSFNYLHENIDEETMRDPVLKRMPLLKNINRRNLIPVIDFEELNKASQTNIYGSGLSNNSGRPVQIQINYLMVYLSSALRTLSTESAASVLFTLPSSQSEDIVFH